jgi:hypothetical protein
MVVESIPLAHARAGGEFLDQFLIPCPACAKPGAAHVGWTSEGQRELVRFVCLDSCAVQDVDVLAALPESLEVGLTA